MGFSVLVDFGSTYTKVVCVDMKTREVVLTDRFPSTVHTDARICLGQCFDAVRKKIGEKDFREALKLSSSSAAGGLRMSVIGLSETLSFTAGKNCAYGAGGKIISNYFGTITKEVAQEIVDAKVEIVLLCGGYEHGNRTVVLHNAEMLAESDMTTPVIFAGNSDVAPEVRRMFGAAGKELFLVQNIIPGVGELNTADAEDLIRNLFMKRITNMKGLSEIQAEIGEVVMPTPAAVLTAGTLLSKGTEKTDGLGPLMMVDVGGATTDVYSFCANTGFKGSKLVGAVEPYAKRTVEGDMGMRESSICIEREVGLDALAEGAGVTSEVMRQAIDRRITETSYLADSPEQANIDTELASRAISISVRRHAGRVHHVVAGGGVQNQTGKNLTRIRTIVGTGGVVVNHPTPDVLMNRLFLQNGESEDVLIPRKGEVYVDKQYVFYAAGLLEAHDPDTALMIMKKSMKKQGRD